LLLGVILFGSNIMLIAQIYHIDSHFPNGVLMWSLGALLAAWLVRNADLDEEKQPELRDGHSGAGVYDKDDWRIDLGDPDDP